MLFWTYDEDGLCKRFCFQANRTSQTAIPVGVCKIEFSSISRDSFDPGKVPFSETPDAMSDSNLLPPSQEGSRNSRSHSLKAQSQPFLLPPRPKRRTLSLPSKPIIPPNIIIQGCRNYNNQENESDEEDKVINERHKDTMAWYTPVLGLSCSLLMYFWSCVLAYYSAR